MRTLIFIRGLLGQKYLHNIASNEIHRLSNRHVNCKLEYMNRENRLWLSEYQVSLALDNGADGCCWCYDEKDTDTPPRTRPIRRPG